MPGRQAALLSQTTAALLDEIEALRRTIGDLQRGLVRIRMESAKNLMTHAALDEAPPADDATGEAQHLEAGRQRLQCAPIHRTEDVECRATPRQEVVALIARPADQVGYDRHRQSAREILHAVDLTSDQCSIDHPAGLLGTPNSPNARTALSRSMPCGSWTTYTNHPRRSNP